MLISENLLSSLKEHIKVTDIFGSLPFQYNNTEKCFKLKSKNKFAFYKFRLWLCKLFAFLVFSQLLFVWKNINAFVKLHSIFNYSALLMNVYTHHVFCSKADLIVSYLNGMLAFEKHRNGNALKLFCILGTRIKIDMFQYFQLTNGDQKTKQTTCSPSML